MSTLRKVGGTVLAALLVAVLAVYVWFEFVVNPRFKMAHAESKSTVSVPANPVFLQSPTLPAISPDGKWSASLGTREWTDPKESGAIVVKNLQTQSEHLYLIDGNGYFIDERSFSWNADNRRLIFAEHRVPNSSVKQQLVIDAVAQTQSRYCRFPRHISVGNSGGKWYLGNRLVIVDDRWVDKGRPDRVLVTKPDSCKVDYQIPVPGVARDQQSELAVQVDDSGNVLLISQYVHDMNGPEPGFNKPERTWTWNERDGLKVAPPRQASQHTREAIA